ncbi:MAG: hypothetical protein IKA74_06505 [Clostridia bacterium]|nr:hypothetical protein [Clostridia bacterium]
MAIKGSSSLPSRIQRAVGWCKAAVTGGEVVLLLWEERLCRLEPIAYLRYGY